MLRAVSPTIITSRRGLRPGAAAASCTGCKGSRGACALRRSVAATRPAEYSTLPGVIW